MIEYQSGGESWKRQAAYGLLEVRNGDYLAFLGC
eukprot:CAMPEP_0177548748 /NCGR_PEP_ID=MMETSP0369-20130122/64641_1 /TAXON_ID=447022 ORGANISM="Scrippsiella hangoei-like, Strain SHHI-4" /NCGR_SAMPLE_ID=MMETSP0369 /ASSEMBLY_ACC=CAM_ASM_000364 /LENGTH=33 /DNA_ID= /DNA_START= /DNA_END= /DNA_ORIENTATION=